MVSEEHKEKVGGLTPVLALYALSLLLCDT